MQRDAEGAASEREPTTALEEHYQIECVLGQGGAGIVYRVLDRRSGERLALKKLQRIDQNSVLRLKHEFRSLADLHHPNLIKLYTLGRAPDSWFITMEYLPGTDLLSYVGAEADLSDSGELLASIPAPANDNSAASRLTRICHAFAQLARGVGALHGAGMLHRDLKPSNVMVVGQRVVVLDFGLVREVGEQAIAVTRDDAIVGTPAYMAPEQIQRAELTPASDWYAFGVMLYEALSGKLPFVGPLYELLQQKLTQEPVPVSERVPGLPEALCQLCDGLLRREPSARPDHATITQVLGELAPGLVHSTQQTMTTAQRTSLAAQPRPTLFGRHDELSQLQRAFALSQQGHCVVAHVRGPSGSGKSALVEHFLTELDAGQAYGHSDVLILRARCYEREAMPFKALDGLVDALSLFLQDQDDVWVSHVLPVKVGELARAFPVLQRIPATQRLLQRDASWRPAALERESAEQALHELLRRMATQRPLVLFIDDLQWGDLDSIRVIQGWLQADNAIAMLLVLSYRGDELAENLCLRQLLDQEQPRADHELTLDLTPLRHSDIEAMCAASSRQSEPLQPSLVTHIAREARGNPLLASQLLTLAAERKGRGEHLDASTLTIHGLVAQLTALLSDSERALLHVLAVAGRPIDLILASSACGSEPSGHAQLHALQGLGLARTRTVGRQQQLLEVQHDRVREAVVASLSASERAETQARLLDALEQRGYEDPSWLYVLAVGAGRDRVASRYGYAAADRAASGLAFERAAELYRDCLTRSPELAEDGALWRKLGDALAACGRGTQAAAAYIEAARRVGARVRDEQIDLYRFAAAHLIRSGHFMEGEALVRKVLAAMQLQVPTTHSGLIAAIAWERLALAARGLDFSAHSRAELPAERVREALVYASLSIDTQAYDPVRAALFQARSLRLSLSLGEPKLVAGALCAAATTRGVSGSASDARHAERLLELASSIASSIEDPLVDARVASARAMGAFLSGKVKETLALAAEAEKRYQNPRCLSTDLPGEYYHRFAVDSARIGALFQLGRIHQASTALRQALSHARVTENRTAQLHLALVWSIDEIAHGQPERARARLDRDRPALPPSFGPLHMLHAVAVMRVGCTLHDYDWVQSVLDDMWPRFESSFVRKSVLSLLAYGAHARFVLNRHVLRGDAGNPERQIRGDLRALRSLSKRLSPATYSRFVARLSYLRGGHARAIDHYREHIDACERGGYLDEVERGRWALGRLLPEPEGSALQTQAIATLAAMGFAQPLAEVRSHFPELCSAEELLSRKPDTDLPART